MKSLSIPGKFSYPPGAMDIRAVCINMKAPLYQKEPDTEVPVGGSYGKFLLSPSIPQRWRLHPRGYIWHDEL